MGSVYSGNDPIVVSMAELHKLFEEEFGEDFTFAELSPRIGVSENTLSHRFTMPFITFRTADRWLTALGLIRAVGQGRIQLYRHPAWPLDAFNVYFTSRGDNPPADVISWEEKIAA